MAKQKARLKDIAAQTGYGTNTVSLALRGSTRISAAAREKIAKVALELDYVPNHIAKSLVSRRSHTVGLILHEITNPILTTAAEESSAPSPPAATGCSSPRPTAASRRRCARSSCFARAWSMGC